MRLIHEHEPAFSWRRVRHAWSRRHARDCTCDRCAPPETQIPEEEEQESLDLRHGAAHIETKEGPE